MSLKFKLNFKRAFLKANLFLIIITVFFSIFLCLGVSAEQRNSSILINFTEARATDYYDGYYGTFYTLSPAKLLSPYGGTAQCFKFSSSQNVSGVRGKDAKFYFNNYTFKKDVKYTIDTYIFYPWAQLINNDSSYPDSIIDMQLFLCDKENKSRVDFDIPKDMPLLNGTNWDYMALKDGNSSAYFGFYKTSVTFVPNENFVGCYFDFSISHTHQTTSGGYFGLSDLILSYEYDPLTDPNFNAPDEGSINNHNSLTSEIDSATSAGREQAVRIMNLSGDNYTDIFNGLLMWTKFIDTTLASLDWYSYLLEFGLAVGLFAFLLGLGIYAVGKLGKKSSGGKKGGGG